MSEREPRTPTERHQRPEPRERIWHGALADPTALAEDTVRQGHSLADAARNGDWHTVTAILDADDCPWTVNTWRPGGTTRYTPVHQAAWHGAPASVLDELIHRGAWLTQRTADGATAHDIATARGHHSAAELLQPKPLQHLDPDKAAALDRHLADLVESRIRPHLTVQLVHPQCSVLTEMPDTSRLWYPIPGMYGGFSIQLMRGYLYTESWCRVVGGSGQAHVITTQGHVLVDEGFV